MFTVENEGETEKTEARGMTRMVWSFLWWFFPGPKIYFGLCTTISARLLPHRCRPSAFSWMTSAVLTEELCNHWRLGNRDAPQRVWPRDHVQMTELVCDANRLNMPRNGSVQRLFWSQRCVAFLKMMEPTLTLNPTTEPCKHGKPNLCGGFCSSWSMNSSTPLITTSLIMFPFLCMQHH